MNKIYTRAIPFAAFGMSAGLLWDSWWHVAIGRDQFWIPPHILLYVCLAIILVVSFIAWQKTKIIEFRNLFFITCLFPITGVLDQFWHSIFGVENLVSPIVVWSPPHLMILASLIAVTFYSRKIASFDESIHLKWMMECIIFGSILGFALIFLVPLHPLGAYHIFGFWGAGILTFIWLAITLYAQNKIKETGTVILITLIFSVLLCISPATIIKPAEGIIIGSIYNPPAWVFIFSYLVPAIFLEIVNKWNSILKSMVAGILTSFIFYFTAVYFIDISFYGKPEIIQAVFSSLIGGLFAGMLFMTYIKKDIL